MQTTRECERPRTTAKKTLGTQSKTEFNASSRKTFQTNFTQPNSTILLISTTSQGIPRIVEQDDICRPSVSVIDRAPLIIYSGRTEKKKKDRFQWMITKNVPDKLHSTKIAHRRCPICFQEIWKINFGKDHIGNAGRTIHDVETDRGPKKVTGRQVSGRFILAI